MNACLSNFRINYRHRELQTCLASFVGRVISRFFIVWWAHKFTINNDYPYVTFFPQFFGKNLDTVVLIKNVVHEIPKPLLKVSKVNHAPNVQELQGEHYKRSWKTPDMTAINKAAIGTPFSPLDCS